MNATTNKTGFFKDKNGQFVIWQSPNIPIYGWIAFKLLSMLVASGYLKTGFENLSSAALFTWAYLEVYSGMSYFRRLLGVVVLVSIVIGYFR